MNPDELARALREIADAVDASETPSMRAVRASLKTIIVAADPHDEFYKSREWKEDPASRKNVREVEKRLEKGEGDGDPRKVVKDVLNGPKDKLPPVRSDEVRTGPKAVPPPPKLPKQAPEQSRGKWDVTSPDFKPKKPYGDNKPPAWTQTKETREQTKKREENKGKSESTRDTLKGKIEQKPEFQSFETFADFIDDDDRDVYTKEEADMFAKLHPEEHDRGDNRGMVSVPMDMKMIVKVMQGFGKYLELPSPVSGSRIPNSIIFEVAEKLGISEEDVRQFCSKNKDKYQSIESIADAMTSPDT